MPSIPEMADYFNQVGADQVGHTDKTYLAHAVNVHNDLKKWGAGERVAQAGFFHSIYGTERFQKFTLPLEHRHEVQSLIGEFAEQLVWLNCAMDRTHFDQEAAKPQGPYHILDRFSGSLISVSDPDFETLCTIHLCDWLEQVPRSQDWDYRKPTYRCIAERLGGVALESFNAVYSESLSAD